MRDLELPGRSPAHGMKAMAATSHTLSTNAAIDILRKGGNAMDAAIAACAVQCVVEPGSTGIGGDNFCLYWPAGADAPVAFNGSGKAPTGATCDYFASEGITELPPMFAALTPSNLEDADRALVEHGVFAPKND